MNLNHIAIVGLGSIGRRHLRLLKNIRPNIEVTLLRSGKGQECPEESLAVRSVSTIEEAVDAGIQAAIISSPSPFHLQQAEQLGKAGVHLLVEKPLSHNSDGVEKFLEKVSVLGIVGLTGYVLRYDQAARAFSKMLHEELPGHLLHVRVECGSYLPDWRPNQDYRTSVSAKLVLGGGALLELSHELDYVHWFFGAPKCVYAHLNNSGTLGVAPEESVELVLVNSKNLPISVHLDFNRRHKTRYCSVHGTGGTLTWDAIQKEVNWLPVEGKAKVMRFDFGPDDMYVRQLVHFLDCIENGADPAVSLEDGGIVLRLVDAARRSHETGRRVDLI